MVTPVELRFQPRIGDTVWATQAALRARPTLFYSALMMFGVLPVVLVVIELALAGTRGHAISGLKIAAMICIPLCMFGGARLVPYLLLRNSPLLRDEQVHRYEADGVVFRGATFENYMRWSAVSHATWIDGGLLLSNGKLLLAAVHPRLLTDQTRRNLQSLLSRAGIPAKGGPANEESHR